MFVPLTIVSIFRRENMRNFLECVIPHSDKFSVISIKNDASNPKLDEYGTPLWWTHNSATENNELTFLTKVPLFMNFE